MLHKIRYFWLFLVVSVTSHNAYADGVDKVKDEVVKLAENADVNKLSSKASTFLHNASVGTSVLVGGVLLFFVARFILNAMIKMAFLVLVAGCAYAYLYLDYQTYLKDWFGIVLP